MNLLKTLTLGLAAVAMTGVASATPTIIHVTGSTAFRASATAAIINYIGTANGHAAFSGSSPIGKGTLQIFANGTIGASGTATVIIETDWTGSLAGVVDVVAQNTSLPFIDPSNAAVITAVNGSTVTAAPYTGGATLSSPATVTSAPEVAFADAFQTSTAASVATAGTLTPAININGTLVTNAAALAVKINAANLVEAGAGSTPGAGTATGTVGIIPFEWVLGNYAGFTGSNAPFTNITQQSAVALIKNGSVPVSFLNPAGSINDFVYLVGRSEDSGTRIINFAEPQTGFGGSAAQFLLSFSGNQKTTGAVPLPDFGVQVGGFTDGTHFSVVQSADFWPSNSRVNTELSLNWNLTGHSGYVSGGDVANVLAALNPTVVTTLGTVNDASKIFIPNAPFENVPNSEGGAGGATPKAYFVGYLGVADAGGTTVTVHNGTALTYNGVAYSPAAVTAGAYTLWGFEHIYYINSGFGAIGSPQKAVIDTIADSISTTFAATNSNGVLNPSGGDGAGIHYDPNTGVSRTAEGGQISINY